ncbi:MAG TPA: hypothetical protein VEV41_05590, partial [Terriglobales bacterium]|nr:hypothetical protein [Terriglobales bacterium]
FFMLNEQSLESFSFLFSRLGLLRSYVDLEDWRSMKLGLFYCFLDNELTSQFAARGSRTIKAQSTPLTGSAHCARVAKPRRW